MNVSVGVNPLCEKCGEMTFHHSDHSGGWNKCPSCGYIQNVSRTPGGESGFLDTWKENA